MGILKPCPLFKKCDDFVKVLCKPAKECYSLTRERTREKGKTMATIKTNKTYQTKAYEGFATYFPAGDTATITAEYTTRWGKMYDVATAHNGKYNVSETVLNQILNLN